MTQKTNHFKLGLFVLSGLVVGLGSLLYFGANTLIVEKGQVWIAFSESVNGLEVGSPVKYRGVTLGSVADIGFAPDRKTVVVEVDIMFDKMRAADLGGPGGETPEEFAAQLASAGITGGKFIRMDLFDTARFPRQPEPPVWPEHVDTEEVIPTVYSTLRNLEESIYAIADGLPKALEDVDDLMQELKSLSRNVNELTEGEVKQILVKVLDHVETLDVASLQAEVMQVFDDIDPAVQNIGEITAAVRDNRDRIEGLVENASSLAASLETAIDDSDIPGTLADFRGAAVTANGAAREAQRVSRDVALLVEESRAGLAELQRTLAAVKSLADLIERDPGVLLRGRESPSYQPRNR